ncbi:hypothetical protein [Sphingobacterium sp. NPDC055346]
MNVLDIATELLLLENGGCRKINRKEELEQFYVPLGTFDRGNPPENDSKNSF